MVSKEQGGAGASEDWFAFTARRVVGRAMGVAESDLRGENRDRQEVAFARQVSMYLAHVAYQLSYTEVARSFGRDRTTVHHACAVIEDAREDGSAFDVLLDTLEERLGDLAQLSQGRRTALPPMPRPPSDRPILPH